MKKVLLTVISLLVVIGASILGGYLWGERASTRAVEIQNDTIIEYRTIEVLKPIKITEKTIDTIKVYVDSSKYIPLPKTQSVYSGDNYTLAVSGYQPNLDYINLTIPTKTITVYPPAHRVYLDATLSYCKGLELAPTVNYGYTNGRWEFYAGAGYAFRSQSIALNLGVSFDIYRW